MTSEVMNRLAFAKDRADATKRVRQNYRSFVEDRVENGGWSERDVEDYRAEVGRIMERGTDDEQAAAREFWAAKSGGAISAIGINDRIAARIKEQKK